MKFFEPDDFEYDSIYIEDILYIRVEYAINRANEKLEKEARQVHFKMHPDNTIVFEAPFNNKGLLINIELLEKCKHLGAFYSGYKNYFKCSSCGVELIPDTFKEVSNDK